MRSLLIALAVLCFAGAAFAAMPFADVPANHWAYDAIGKAVDAGILQGFDGQFHGKKLLNRYQVAVIVAKMLDLKTGKPIAGKDGKGVENIEALTIEFADELALLNVKVSTLEDSFVEMKNDIEKMKGGHVAATGDGSVGTIGFSGFASFAMIMADDYNTGAGALPPSSGEFLTPYADKADTNFFTDPIVALGAQKDLSEGIQFNLRLVSDTDVNGGGASVGVEHAYFKMDQLLGKNVGGNVGAFSFEKLSLEANGAYGTPDYTINPSMLNAGWRQYHAYGIDFMNKPDKAGDIQFSLALLSGTDATPEFALVNGSEWGMLSNCLEGDDGFGYLLFVKKPRADTKFGWNFSYFDNGGDANPGAGVAAASDEFDMVQLGFDYGATKDLNLLLQYADGSRLEKGALAGTPEEDATLWYFLLNYKLDAKQSLTLRYETDTYNSGAAGAQDYSVKTITFAYNRKVTENSMFQFEYLAPEDEVDGAVNWVDANDDLIQFRYKVWF